MLAEGPSGGFTAARRPRRKVLLLAGGVGITPLRALFETLPGAPGDITLIYRVAQAEDIVLRDELDWIAPQRGAVVHYLVGPPRHGANDHLSAPRLARLVPGHRRARCLPLRSGADDGRRRALVAALRLPRRHIHLESFVF